MLGAKIESIYPEKASRAVPSVAGEGPGGGLVTQEQRAAAELYRRYGEAMVCREIHKCGVMGCGKEVEGLLSADA